jgi:thermitase
VITRRVDLHLRYPADVAKINRRFGEIDAFQAVKAKAREIAGRPRRLVVEFLGDAHKVADTLRDVTDELRARIIRDEVSAVPGAPTDPVYPDLDSLRRLVGSDVKPGGEVPAHAPPVIVAIVDTGVMTQHPDLKGHLVNGVSVIGSNPADIEDQDGHGTLLAGTILTVTQHSPTVKIRPIKFIDGRTRPDADRAAKAIDQALTMGARIINLSFELGLESSRLRDAMKRASEQDVLVVVAAGNSGADNDRYPTFPACYGHAGCKALPKSAFPNVITVMATDRFDQKPGFSNYGNKSVHIAAPGSGVVSTHQYLGAINKASKLARYQRYDGTSAACAYVAGAAALVRSKYPALSAEEVRDRLIGTVERQPDLRCQAGGRLNLSGAL